MIKKELDLFVAEDKYAVAGQKAEEQMAFYLKRFFASSSNVFVLNGIRLEHNDDAAQMDHLVLHPYGICVVESKSVAGKIQIKDDGQWIRWYGKESTGMASPITQAKLQVRFMRDYLNLAVKPKGAFDRYAFDVLVAISDNGVILRPTTGGLPEVCKSDQVAERIECRIAELAKQPNVPAPWTTEHLSKIADFLCGAHKPLSLRVAEKLSSKYQHAADEQIVAIENASENKSGDSSVLVEQADIAVAPILNKPPVGSACKHCASEDVLILYGHSYYFHCNVCNKNTPLKSECSKCGALEMPRKKSKEFFLECKTCSISRLFHVNN